MMKQILSEKSLVVILFVMVIVFFSLAQEDTKNIEKIYPRTGNGSTSQNQDVLRPLETITEGAIVPSAELR